MNDREIGRMEFRVALFVKRGVKEATAERLADVLHRRDVDGDDRRMCLECAGFRGLARSCPSGAYPIRGLLHRCGRFEWMKPQ